MELAKIEYTDLLTAWHKFNNHEAKIWYEAEIWTDMTTMMFNTLGNSSKI